ncbi:protein Lines homolog 1 isoform X2 [Sander lucioperca]|uniref:protein Lines homolog 1 isoform X2 n=1 Tax=Sander lucioperca TaxID=283035 RepID=UPI00125D54D7|nr:protein Lines homolog 1 isoform X2 [Sander lucioperca]
MVPHGRGSTMEHSASCRDLSTMRERFDCLTEAYTCFLMGTCPSQCVACVIFSGLVPGEDREYAPSENRRVNSAELSCISMSLVEKITSNLTSRSLSPAVTLYCVEMLTVLFQDMDLMSLLMQQFQAEDQIISHLAAKTVSTWVLYQLHKSGTVSPVWQQKCVQAFYISLPGPELDTCLWSLTEVLKRLLKGAHQEILWKLLAAFDSSLSTLCSKFLPKERDETTRCLVDHPSSSSSGRWGTTFCLLLDLLELLTACSVICGAGICLESPRMTYVHSSALLMTISCPSEYFVKKRVLLLLKRAVLQKAGEDWALGEVLLTGLKHKHFDSDMSVLSQSVLTAVATDWLHSVQVESSSFFGGTRSIRGEEGQKPDCVMLRAVSLLLLKSMELHIQTAGRTGVDSFTEVSGYLQSLWGFLRRCIVQLTENSHRCCWVSLLFGEQDDDMMEAAKALFSIFLHRRMCSGLEDFAVLEAACASGCNPHCHFLLLLQSISFDHSILLDFLISTETCFLEYFVRYLKFLRADWQGFTATCGRIRLPHFHLSLQQSLTALCAADTLKVTCKDEPDQVKFSSCAQSTGATSPVGRVSLAAGFHLVEYDSSDESDPENMEVSQDEPVTVCDKSTFSALDVKQEISGPPVPIRQKQYEASDSTGLLSQPNTTLERRAEGPSLPVLQSEQTSGPNMAPQPGQVAWETLARAVVCMSELREVVTRLQTNKLFPYNPSSLLKLLAQVENCSKLSRFLHFNK